MEVCSSAEYSPGAGSGISVVTSGSSRKGVDSAFSGVSVGSLGCSASGSASGTSTNAACEDSSTSLSADSCGADSAALACSSVSDSSSREVNSSRRSTPAPGLASTKTSAAGGFSSAIMRSWIALTSVPRLESAPSCQAAGNSAEKRIRACSPRAS